MKLVTIVREEDEDVTMLAALVTFTGEWSQRKGPRARNSKTSREPKWESRPIHEDPKGYKTDDDETSDVTDKVFEDLLDTSTRRDATLV